MHHLLYKLKGTGNCYPSYSAGAPILFSIRPHLLIILFEVTLYYMRIITLEDKRVNICNIPEKCYLVIYVN